VQDQLIGAMRGGRDIAPRTLVLDDDPFMLQLLSRMLAVQGYTRVAQFQTARLALACLDEAARLPSLVLCDLNMPDMDGIEFVRALVDRGFPGALILVSGEMPRVLEAAEQLARAHGIKVLGHLHKPVAGTDLAALLQTWRGSPPPAPGALRERTPDELEAALAQGEIVNHYQPKVDVVTGRVLGVEALARWLHPVDGVIPPDGFIALAEECGLIDDVTHAVINAALTDCATWRAAHLDLDVAINVSMSSLMSLEFPDLFAEQAATARIDSAKIIIEVTESRWKSDLRAPLDVLTRLRLKGFRVSIDDFGTGHSSLIQLRDFPFNELKLDRSFVHHAGRDATLRAIYEACVGLGRQLRMDTVAEGVEDREDWDFVSATGCPIAQGYFIAKPMPADAIPAWIKGWADRWLLELYSEAVATT
jgi:EAL domain-containing protein (putative c-di-GMP-specific phosphodiesterase class I)/ActR/RegA family two-component response regulator